MFDYIRVSSKTGENVQVAFHSLEYESPIHINELFKRISECCNVKRLSPKMKSTIDLAVGRTKGVIRRGNSVQKFMICVDSQNK